MSREQAPIEVADRMGIPPLLLARHEDDRRMTFRSYGDGPLPDGGATRSIAENPATRSGETPLKGGTVDWPSFEKCVHAIADTMAQQDCLPATSKGTVDAVANYLMATHVRMPDYMRLGFWVLVVVFDIWPYATSGRHFHRLDFEQRCHHLDGWEHSRMGFRRSLVALFRALVNFGLATERDKCA